MNIEQFKEELEVYLNSIKELFDRKSKEYSHNQTAFYNFEEASKISGYSPESCLDGFLMKHYVSYRDMLKDIENGQYPPIEKIDEKLGDIILYFILQKIQMKHNAIN